MAIEKEFLKQISSVCCVNTEIDNLVEEKDMLGDIQENKFYISIPQQIFICVYVCIKRQLSVCIV